MKGGGAGVPASRSASRDVSSPERTSAVTKPVGNAKSKLRRRRILPGTPALDDGCASGRSAGCSCLRRRRSKGGCDRLLPSLSPSSGHAAYDGKDLRRRPRARPGLPRPTL